MGDITTTSTAAVNNNNNNNVNTTSSKMGTWDRKRRTAILGVKTGMLGEVMAIVSGVAENFMKAVVF